MASHNKYYFFSSEFSLFTSVFSSPPPSILSSSLSISSLLLCISADDWTRVVSKFLLVYGPWSRITKTKTIKEKEKEKNNFIWRRLICKIREFDNFFFLRFLSSVLFHIETCCSCVVSICLRLPVLLRKNDCDANLFYGFVLVSHCHKIDITTFTQWLKLSAHPVNCALWRFDPVERLPITVDGQKLCIPIVCV